MMMRVAPVLMLFWCSLQASDDVFAPFDGPRAKVMVLGVFHFRNPGLDSYKPKHVVDVMSEKRQKEIDEILAVLKRFAPTHIAVERMPELDQKINDAYTRYRAGSFDPSADEMHQIGFKLAKELGHERVYPVDARRHHLLSDQEYDKLNNGAQKAWENFLTANPQASKWNYLMEAYQKHSELADAHKMNHTLLEHLLLLNSERYNRISHGQYVSGWGMQVEGLKNGNADSTAAWYIRNLRIVENVQRLASSPERRVLVIFGVGHKSIMDHALGASPQFELVELADYVKGSGGK